MKGNAAYEQFTRAAELHTRKGKAKGAKIPMAAFLHDYYNIAGQEMQIIPVRLFKKIWMKMENRISGK